MSSTSPSEAALPALSACRIVNLPKITDPRGNLTFMESSRAVPFPIRRAYWIYDVPGGEHRGGGHAYFRLDEFLVALSGSFDVTVDDGTDSRTFTLNRSYFGLYVPAALWRRIDNFSTNSVCLVMSSGAYHPDEYQRDRAQYLRWRAGGAA